MYMLMLYKMFTFTFTNSTFIVVKWILVFQTSMFSMEKNINLRQALHLFSLRENGVSLQLHWRKRASLYNIVMYYVM